MANRVPLIVDTSTLYLKELPTGDNLDLTDSGIIGLTGIAGTNANFSGIVTALGGFNIGIQSGGAGVTTGVVTAFNFIGAGNTFQYNLDTKTIDISIGGGQWTYSDTLNTETSSIYRLNGNVGLGTQVPIQKFQVGLAETANVSTSGEIFVVTSTGSVGLGTTNPSQKIQVGSASTQSVFVTGIGSVGIGTVNPTHSLHVFGNSRLERVAVTTTSSNITLQPGFTYVFYDGTTTLTLPALPVTGDTLRIINRSSSTTTTIARNGSNIMGAADDVLFDYLNETFNFTYINTPDGWVISR